MLQKTYFSTYFTYLSTYFKLSFIKKLYLNINIPLLCQFCIYLKKLSHRGEPRKISPLAGPGDFGFYLIAAIHVVKIY